MKPIRDHVAPANLARMRAPLDSLVMEGFRSQLDRINAIADSSPGFVWRLQTAEGDATTIRVCDDERILFHLSVWESIESLHAYVYRSAHAGPLRYRREWFEPLGGAALVLWWIPAGHIPSVEESMARLDVLRSRGPTPEAFTFSTSFSPSGQPRPSLRDEVG